MKKRIIMILIILTLIFLIPLVSASDVMENSDLETEDNNLYIENNNEVNLKSEPTTSKTVSLTSNNFDEYVTNGIFNDKISDGDTVDFQGKFDSERFNLTVNKSLNIVGSEDNFINLYGSGIFKINSGASGSNITGINFEHTRIMSDNVTNLTFTNCTVIAEHNVGFGVGMFSVRDNSDNITISDCYFETANNGGHSNVVFAGATNVIFENNTIVGKSTVGNLLYLTTYNSQAENLTYGNQNITIRNNYIDGKEVNVAEICYAIAIEGNNIIIENNTVEYNGKCIVPQWGQGKQNNITIINNIIPNGICYLSFPNQTVNGNVLCDIQSNNNELYNNTIKKVSTLGNLTLDGNNIESVTINGANVSINNNTIVTKEGYAINTNNNSNIRITNNKLSSLKGRGNEAINGSTELTENNTIASSTIFINNDNLNEFFIKEESGLFNVYYTVKDDKIYENDSLIMNLDTSELGRYFTFKFNTSLIIKEIIANGSVQAQQGTIEIINNAQPLYLIDSNIYISIDKGFTFSAKSIDVINSTIHSENGFTFTGTPVTIINSTLSKSTVTIDGENTNIIQSKFITPPGGLSSRIVINGNIINSSLPGITIYSNNAIVINSTVYKLGKYNKVESTNNLELSNLIKVSNNYILTYLYTIYKNIVNETTGLLMDSIVEGDILNVLEYDNENVNIIIDRPVNLIGIKDEGIIKANITFVEGSEGTNITNVTFNGAVNINTTDINFVEGNIFNGEFNSVFIPETNIPTIININCSNIVVNNVETPLSVNVTTMNGTLITEGYVEIYNEGILVEKTNLTEGTVNCIIKIDRIVSNNSIRVWYYPEDNTYLQNNTIFNITSIKSNVTLIVENNTVRVNENETVTVLVSADNNMIVNGGNVTFIIRSWKFDVPVEDGMAKLNLIVNESWYERPNLRLTYSGSDLYNYQSTSNIAMNILEAFPITLQIDNTEFTAGENTNIQASIYKGDDVYTQINKGKITFKVNGKTLKDTNGKVIYAKVVNGTAIIENYEIPSTWNNNTTIEATYTGSAQQATIKSEKTNITLSPTQPTMSIVNITSTPSETIQLTAQITQSNNPINTGKVVFKVNGKTVKDSNGKVIYAKVTDGVAAINYTIPENMKIDTYEIKAIFTATGYEKLENTGTLTIARVENS